MRKRKTIPSSKLELADAIRVMAKILYERECVKNEGPIYTFYSTFLKTCVAQPRKKIYLSLLRKLEAFAQ